MQAILSQFSKTNKATTDPDKDNKDDTVLRRLQEDDNTEEMDSDDDDDDDGDEIDSTVEASDGAIVDEVAQDLEQELFGEERLTRDDINLGQFSLLKVCLSTLFNILFLTCVNLSFQILERGFLIVQHCMLISNPAMNALRSNQLS